MAFDVESAKRAGYTDAEIAAHLAQSTGFDVKAARSAGYTDGDVIAHLSAKVKPRAVIPGQEGEQARRAANAAQPAPTLGERVVGAGEAALSLATGATGGTIGMIGGTLKGLAEQILSGQFGTPQAAKMVEESAAGGAAALTFAPRTEQGQQQVQAVGEALQQLVPIAGLTPQVQAITAARPAGTPAAVVARAGAEGTARAVGGETAAAGVSATLNGASRVAALAGKQVTTLPRRALEALQREPDAPKPTPGTMGSAGAAGTDMAAQRRALAADLPVPVRLTRGQALRDPEQLKFEVESAKLPEQGAPLRERYIEQQQQFYKNFDVWVDQTGAQAPNLREVGAAVDTALVNQAKADKARIRTAYKAAEQAGEMEAPVQLQSLVEHLNESAPDAATAPILDVARRRAVQLGIAREEGGQLVPQPTTLRLAETYRQAINRATDYEATNVRQSTIIKGLVDESTQGLGGDLYRSARALRARYAQNYEDRATVSQLLSKKRGTDDRRVAFEDVFDHIVLKGSLDDVRNVRRVLQRGGSEGQQAWKELQGETVRWVRGQAERNSATDSMGNRVMSVDGLDRAIRTLDADGRLEFIFGRKGAQQMRDIRDLAQIARTVPPEAAINTSNTASTLLAAFADAGIIGSTGGLVPVPIASMARLVRVHVKDKALRRRIEEALGDIQKKAPNNRGKAPPVMDPPPTLQ